MKNGKKAPSKRKMLDGYSAQLSYILESFEYAKKTLSIWNYVNNLSLLHNIADIYTEKYLNVYTRKQ